MISKILEKFKKNGNVPPKFGCSLPEGYSIVVFGSGEYGIKHTTGKNDVKFVDLKTPSLSWRKNSEYIRDCRGTQKEVNDVLLQLTLIKEEEYKEKLAQEYEEIPLDMWSFESPETKEKR